MSNTGAILVIMKRMYLSGIKLKRLSGISTMLLITNSPKYKRNSANTILLKFDCKKYLESFSTNPLTKGTKNLNSIQTCIRGRFFDEEI